MKYLELFFKKVYAFYGTVVFSAIMVVLFPFVLALSYFGRKGVWVGFYLVKLWCFLFHALTFVYVKMKVSKNVKASESYMYVGNHTSMLDTTATPISIPGTVRPLGKKELAKVPLLGQVLRQYGVYVDRSDRASRRKSVEKLIEKAKQGDSIYIFPEGTMNRTGKILQDFHSGAFRIAKETGLDIVPMVTHNAGKIMPPSKFLFRPGIIEVEIGDPIPVDQYTAQELQDISRKWILERLEAKQGRA